MDKELGQLRKKRWNDAFTESDKTRDGNGGGTDVEAKTFSTNRRATIVIEHLIQASDVSHTMQVSFGFVILPPACTMALVSRINRVI
jgi:hypothetical protein